MKKQTILYIILYAMGLVLAVGVALSLIFQALRPIQEANMANDTRKQILAAALITPEKEESIADLYRQHIVKSYIVNSQGKVIDTDKSAFDVNVAQQVKKPENKRELPVYECQTDKGLKYILPVYGAGLWGPIWGYVAFDANGNTIYGAYFAHEGETPGLGAEIEKPAFSSQFAGKDIFNQAGNFTSVAVVKAGQKPNDGDYVNAVSGGTITSQGVQRMLANSLAPYATFLKNLNDATE